MTAGATAIDRRTFRVWLWDGRRINCSAIEQSPHGLAVVSTLGERFASDLIREVLP